MVSKGDALAPRMLALVGLVVSPAAVLVAQTSPSQPGPVPLESTDTMDRQRLAREAARQAMHQARESAKRVREGYTEPPAEQRERRRLARRDAWEKLSGQLAGRAISVPLRDEIRKHVKRRAALARIEVLADAAEDAATLRRVARLLQRENARHQARLGQLLLEAPLAEPPQGKQVP